MPLDMLFVELTILMISNYRLNLRDDRYCNYLHLYA